jgi:hypothetical protein
VAATLLARHSWAAAAAAAAALLGVQEFEVFFLSLAIPAMVYGLWQVSRLVEAKKGLHSKACQI